MDKKEKINKGYWLGKKRSKEDRKKMSEAKKGKYCGDKNPFFGKTHSEEVRKKISESNKGKKQLSGFKKGHIPWNKGKKGFLSGENHYNWQGGLTTRERKIFLNQRRYAKKKNAEGSHTLQEWLDLKKEYDYKCLCCGLGESEVVLTEDHIKPLSLGGSDFISNIQPLCKKCNSIKWAKIIDYRK